MLAAGLVDKLADGGTEVVMKEATHLAEKVKSNASSGVFGLIKVSCSYHATRQ